MTVVELKARMYDLLAAKQNIELEMQKVNQQIIEADKQPKKEAPKEEEKAA